METLSLFQDCSFVFCFLFNTSILEMIVWNKNTVYVVAQKMMFRNVRKPGTIVTQQVRSCPTMIFPSHDMFNFKSLITLWQAYVLQICIV